MGLPSGGVYGDGAGSVYLSELLACAKVDGDLLARAENSGSEGCYVEVARWHDVWGWCRFAFRKFLDDGYKEDAAKVAAEINDACWHKGMVSLIHGMPDWMMAPKEVESR